MFKPDFKFYIRIMIGLAIGFATLSVFKAGERKEENKHLKREKKANEKTIKDVADVNAGRNNPKFVSRVRNKYQRKAK